MSVSYLGLYFLITEIQVVEVSKLHCPVNARSLFLYCTVALDGALGIYQINDTKKRSYCPFVIDKRQTTQYCNLGSLVKVLSWLILTS